jgi:hypothetical protein
LQKLTKQSFLIDSNHNKYCDVWYLNLEFADKIFYDIKSQNLHFPIPTNCNPKIGYIFITKEKLDLSNGIFRQGNLI